MAREDIIKMSIKELKRLKVIQEVIDRHITQKLAASMLLHAAIIVNFREKNKASNAAKSISSSSIKLR